MKNYVPGILAFIAAVINFFAWLAFKDQPGISAENGPMENFQLVCLFLGFTVWLIAGIRSKDKPQKILLLSLGLFCLSFFILEIDTRKLDLPQLTKYIRGKYRNTALALLWIGLFVAFIRNLKPCWNEFLAWLKTPSAVCMIVSGVFWILSGLNDKHLLGRKDLYFEELMEVTSTLLMLLSAILFWSKQKARDLGRP